jgi:glycosyltransferase involved in cell wall biosynthesis
MMISILIPVFNFDVTVLVKSIVNQAIDNNITFEIVCLDDASTDLEIANQNLKINEIALCQYLISKENRGRTATRNELAKTATYEHVLFLDADVLPAKDDFLSRYFEHQLAENQVIFGGLKYRNTDLNDEVSLRWHYGNERETKSAIERQKNPYQQILSCNFYIKRAFYLNLSIPTTHLYGMDNYFSYLLMKTQADVHHIENPVYHLGIETNAIFFEKSLEAVAHRRKWMEETTDFEQISPLISTYKQLQKYGLVPLVRILFKCFSPILKKQIFKTKPNLTAFDLYRLGYLCEISKE